MQSEEQKAYLPKLDIAGDNWVTYWDRLLWIMKGNTIKEHVTNDSPSAAYTVKGKVGRLEPTERWECEEYAICVTLGNSMPDEAFSLIKDTELVKDAWAVLKSTYEDRMAALVSDRMRAF